MGVFINTAESLNWPNTLPFAGIAIELLGKLFNLSDGFAQSGLPPYIFSSRVGSNALISSSNFWHQNVIGDHVMSTYIQYKLACSLILREDNSLNNLLGVACVAIMALNFYFPYHLDNLAAKLYSIHNILWLSYIVLVLWTHDQNNTVHWKENIHGWM